MAEVLQRDVTVLVRVYQSGTNRTSVTQAARFFVRECGFGKIIGSNWLLDVDVRRRIRDYLVSYHHIVNPDEISFDFSGLSRIEAAEILPDEKFAGRGPREGRVLLRGVHGATRINDQCFPSIGSSAIDLHDTDILSLDHDCLIVIENFEAFTGFERLMLSSFPYKSPILAFRGDAVNPAGGTKRLAAKTSLSVVAFTDFDPQGLNIATSTPGVVGAIFPVEFGQLKRADLFNKQRHLLKDTADYPETWRHTVSAMKSAKKGITQEELIAGQISCSYIPTILAE